MKSLITLLAAATLATSTGAQTVQSNPKTEPAPNASASSKRQEQHAAQANGMIAANFAKADKNHDGKVTRAEATGVMPAVTKNFDEIDATKSGSVTLAQIEAFFAARRAEREAERDKLRAAARAKRAAAASEPAKKP